MDLFGLYRTLEENQEKKNNFLATVVEGPDTGSRLLFSGGELKGEYGNINPTPEECTVLTESGQSQLIMIEDRKFFVERLRRPAHLVICGGGHVSQQVLLLAKHVGFFVTVIEDRPFFADKARRAGADLVICEEFEEALKTIPGSEDTYFLVVTRGHRHDRICLDAILKKPRCYVGMMASRGRVALLKNQMEEEGTDRQALDEIHTPVGLSIHAETPEEIAVSIVSELIMEKNSLQKTSGYDEELLEYLTGEREPETGKVLVTIISRRGSAPREIGTKMLVLEDGRVIGTIGGGCTESEVQHTGLRMLREGKKSGRIMKVDMTAAQAEEEGLVCGGTIEIFLEMLQPHLL